LPMTGRVGSPAFPPDGQALAIGGPDDGAVRLWDPATGRPLAVLGSPPDPATPRGMREGVAGVAFSPDGRAVAAVSRYRYPSNLIPTGPGERRNNRRGRVWEVATGKVRAELRLALNAAGCAAFSADGQTLVLGAKDGAVTLWRPLTGQQARLAPAHGDAVTAVALAPGGKSFATASKDTTVL